MVEKIMGKVLTAGVLVLLILLVVWGIVACADGVAGVLS